MAKSITRFFKVAWYTITACRNKQVERLMENPEAVRGLYEDVIRYKLSRIQRYKLGIGRLIPFVEQKKNLLNELTNEIALLEKQKADAIAKSESTAAELQKAGMSEEEIEQHPDSIDLALAEKKVRVAKVEHELERLQNDIEDHKLQLASLHRDLERFKKEQAEAVAELIQEENDRKSRRR